VSVSFTACVYFHSPQGLFYFFRCVPTGKVHIDRYLRWSIPLKVKSKRLRSKIFITSKLPQCLRAWLNGDFHISHLISQRNEPEEDNFEFVRMDAMVAERLSSSPRTFEIYGYCGLGILSEFFYHGDIEDTAIQGEGYDDKDLHDEEELKPQNDLDGDEKLILALEMAEGIAVMHGFSGGIIVHDDIQLSQFLLNEDKSMLKINDFNRAEFMLFDEASQQYCQYKNGPGGGNVSSFMLFFYVCLSNDPFIAC
jgi:serine/threonine protein kinase